MKMRIYNVEFKISKSMSSSTVKGTVSEFTNKSMTKLLMKGVSYVPKDILVTVSESPQTVELYWLDNYDWSCHTSSPIQTIEVDLVRKSENRIDKRCEDLIKSFVC